MGAAVPYMAAGYVADRAMGGNGMTGAALAGGIGAGTGFALPSFGGSLGTGATAANSLGGGAALMGGTGTAVGTSGATTGILGSSVGNMGLENVTGGVTGQGFSPYATTDTLGQSITQANMPVFSGMDSSIPNPSLGLDTSNSIKDTLTGQPVAPQYNSIPQLEEAPLYTGAETPNFANITKSSEKQIAAAQGGYEEKPLYEKAFDSVMGYAEKNPLAVAGLGITALGGGEGGSANKGYAPSGGVSRQAFNPNKEKLLNIRRA